MSRPVTVMDEEVAQPQKIKSCVSLVDAVRPIPKMRLQMEVEGAVLAGENDVPDF